MWFPVDVIETAQQYTFVADVPGLGKNDIKVRWLVKHLAILVTLQLLVMCPCYSAGVQVASAE